MSQSQGSDLSSENQLGSELLDTDNPAALAKDEIVHLKSIIDTLMTRAKGTNSPELLQTVVMLEEQVSLLTTELNMLQHENKKMNHALSKAEEKLHGLLNQSLAGIVIIDDGLFSYSNPKFNEIFGYTEEEVRRMGPVDVATSNDRPLVAEKIRQRLTGEREQVNYRFKGLHKNGTVIDIEIQSSVVEMEGKKVILSLVIDITEHARAEHEVCLLKERLIELSTHDSLTGLYNRKFVEERISLELTLAGRNGHPVSIIMADLDNFKMLNHHYGHLAGDKVLRVFGELIKNNSRISDIYCRYGGEEFLLVLPQMTKEHASNRAEQLRAMISASPILYGAIPIELTCSFGVASYPKDGLTCEKLIAAADNALHVAKAAGRNRVHVFGL